MECNIALPCRFVFGFSFSSLTGTTLARTFQSDSWQPKVWEDKQTGNRKTRSLRPIPISNNHTYVIDRLSRLRSSALHPRNIITFVPVDMNHPIKITFRTICPSSSIFTIQHIYYTLLKFSPRRCSYCCSSLFLPPHVGVEKKVEKKKQTDR